MDERITLDAEVRTVPDEKAKDLRKAGMIPVVVYGQGDSTTLKIENLALRRVLKEAGTTNLIDINVGSEKRTVVVKEVQAHVARGNLFHVDFYEVDMKSKIVVEAELTPVGIAAPVADGLGSTVQVLYNLQIECMPEDMVSQIEVDLSLIESADDMIHIRDLVVPERIELLADPDAVVMRFEYTAIEEEEEEESEIDLMFAPAADEVEVITKGKQVDDEGFEE